MPQSKTVYRTYPMMGSSTSRSSSSSSEESWYSTNPRNSTNNNSSTGGPDRSSSLVSSSSNSSISSKVPDAPSSSFSGRTLAPCGAGHTCNRATFTIMMADRNTSSTSLLTEPKPGEVFPGEVEVLKAELNNMGGGLGGADNGPRLPSDLGTPGTWDRYSFSTITAEQSQAIFGTKDKDGSIKAFRLRIVPVAENTNPHRDITWIRIKNTCDQIIYSCCLEVSDGDTRPRPSGSYGHGVGASLFLSNDGFILNTTYNQIENYQEYTQLGNNNALKFKYKNNYFNVKEGVGHMNSAYFHNGFITLMKKDNFKNVSLFKETNEQAESKIKEYINENKTPISPPSIALLTLNNGNTYVIDSKGLERFTALDDGDYVPVFVIYSKWQSLDKNQKQEVIELLNKGIYSADSKRHVKNLFQMNFDSNG